MQSDPQTTAEPPRIGPEHGWFGWRYWLARRMYPNPLEIQFPEDRDMMQRLLARTKHECADAKR